MSQDDYIQSRVEAIKSVVDSIATDDDLTDFDITSIINSGILKMEKSTHSIKQRYQQLKELRANKK